MIFQKGNTYLIKILRKDEFKAILQGNNVGLILFNIFILILDFIAVITFIYLNQYLTKGVSRNLILGMVIIGCVLMLLFTLYSLSLLFITKIFYYSNEVSFYQVYVFGKQKAKKIVSKEDLKSFTIACFPYRENDLFYSLSIISNNSSIPNICLIPLSFDENEIKKMLSKLIPIFKINVDILLLNTNDQIVKTFDNVNWEGSKGTESPPITLPNSLVCVREHQLPVSVGEHRVPNNDKH